MAAVVSHPCLDLKRIERLEIMLVSEKKHAIVLRIKEQAFRGLHAREWQHSSNLVASGETPASISHLEVVWPCLTDFLILSALYLSDDISL